MLRVRARGACVRRVEGVRAVDREAGERRVGSLDVDPADERRRFAGVRRDRDLTRGGAIAGQRMPRARAAVRAFAQAARLARRERRVEAGDGLERTGGAAVAVRVRAARRGDQIAGDRDRRGRARAASACRQFGRRRRGRSSRCGRWRRGARARAALLTAALRAGARGRRRVMVVPVSPTMIRARVVARVMPAGGVRAAMVLGFRGGVCLCVCHRRQAPDRQQQRDRAAPREGRGRADR